MGTWWEEADAECTMAGLGDGIKYGKFSPSAVFSGGDAKEKKNVL